MLGQGRTPRGKLLSRRGTATKSVFARSVANKQSKPRVWARYGSVLCLRLYLLCFSALIFYFFLFCGRCLQQKLVRHHDANGDEDVRGAGPRHRQRHGCAGLQPREPSLRHYRTYLAASELQDFPGRMYLHVTICDSVTRSSDQKSRKNRELAKGVCIGFSVIPLVW